MEDKSRGSARGRTYGSPDDSDAGPSSAGSFRIPKTSSSDPSEPLPVGRAGARKRQSELSNVSGKGRFIRLSSSSDNIFLELESC